MPSEILSLLDQRVLVIDGAMGTQIHAADLDLEADFLGLENCSEVVNLTRPDVIQGIHERYFAAGCDAVETNTFGGSTLTLEEFGLGDRTREINRVAAEIARRAADAYSTDKPRYVLGSMGPGTKLPTLGHTSYEALRASYREQAEGLADGGVDAFLVETCQDPLQIKAALGGVMDVRESRGIDTPIFVSVTMEVTGTMLVGTEMAAALAILDPYPVDLISLNCATGPREMGEHIRLLGQTCRKKIGAFPNAGLPQLVDGHPYYPLTPEELADWLLRFVDEDGLNLVGGCCGTTPEHMEAVVHALGVRAPKKRKPAFVPQVTSIYSAVNLAQDNSVLLVGERSNANGSKAFREFLLDGNLDGMVQVGKAQVRDGSHMLDLCVAYVGKDEIADMTQAVARYRTEVPVPLMIDSTDPKVIKTALEMCGGRSVINSINLEEGPEKCHEVLPLAKAHGSAVVALTIDEQGMAKTADDKLRIARRIYDLCVRDYGMRPEDILFDVLTFTICTGNEDDRRLGLETLEGIRRVKEELPGVGLLLGLSNISFGLNPAARHVLNSVYLHHAQKAGLSAAILHSGRIEPLHHIDEEARRTAEDLIFDRRREGYDPLQAFMALFDGVDVKARAARELPADVFERLKWRIVEGERDGLFEDLDEAMTSKEPLAIINQDLLDGMAVVGDLFGRGEMQLPFVLQSAETMKAAVAHLEPHMERTDGDTRGKIVLATVRGDVHDIGKNLVDIIMTNNGYTVFNIGIKQPIQHILDVAHEHQPDAIGMSGLLVKSTVIMRENLEEMNRRHVTTPVILGGAALTRNFVEHDCRSVYGGPVYYAKDAFEGLDLIGRIVGGEQKPAVVAKKQRVSAHVAATVDAVQNAAAATRPEPEEDENLPHRGDLVQAPDLPKPPFWGRRLVESVNLQSVMPFINEVTLFQFQWGYRRKNTPTDEYQRFIDDEVRPIYHELMKQCAKEQILQPRAAYGYWPCFADGEALVLLDPENQSKEVARFDFPRQNGKKHLCISDFFFSQNGQLDTVALQVVTIGQQASDIAREWFAADRYKDYLHLHGLSVEAAEGMAEFIHHQIRGELGIAGQDAREMRNLLKQGYRGSRYSFGYPACPNMEDQAVLLDLLGASEIGIQMGDEFQLWPEQSTSAIVVHHPAARYFTI
ncbi:MAG: methionine synthase [Planctomycetes bacterium]|nr:methionine synthase [Planctomycetota bacterium]MCB9904569.1 methionine synthase [Planctomycetota bacterium]